MVEVRILTEADAVNYKTLRVRSVQEHPEAFAAGPDEEQALPIETVVSRIANSLPDNPYFGAFLDGKMVGIAHLNRHHRKKANHRMYITGMYVTPEARGQGAATALMDAALAYARSLGYIEDVVLAVTVGNDTARQLYLKLGFEPWGIDPRFIRVGEQYHDIEWMVLRLC